MQPSSRTKALVLAGVVSVLMVGAPAAWAVYSPPIGIPAPSFGIDEAHTMYDDATYDFGTGPMPYPDAGSGPYTHYIDNTDPNATNTNNPYGSPDKPRLDIFDGLSRTLAAGSVVEIHGGPYNYTGWKKIISQGTASKPIFIRSVDPNSMVRTQAGTDNLHDLRIEGSYLIMENQEYYDGAYIRIWDNSDHIAIRSCEIHNPTDRWVAIGSVLSMQTYCDDIVVYQNHIHHNRRLKTPPDTPDDCHGVSIGAGTENVWILDNHMHENSGDAFQASHLAIPAPRYIYVGDNEFHDDYENGVDLKSINDVVVSQNVIYGYETSATSAGDAIVVGSNGYDPVPPYGPLRSWILFNDIRDSETGIRVEGAVDCWILGNTIHNLNGNGIILDIDADSDNVNIIGNTIVGTGGDGIHHHWLSGATNFRIENNIISDIAGDHVELGQAIVDETTMDNNLFWENGSDIVIDWGTGGYTGQDAAGINALMNCANNVVGNPAFVDEASDNFRIQGTSAAIDEGFESAAYDDFYNLYSIDIEIDLDEVSRPQGITWDIGAFEYDGTVSNSAPTANAGSDDEITLPSYATLDGTVSDDGLPNPPGSLTTTWSKDSGPGTVTFGDSSAVDTTAGFSVEGTYVLKLEADDGTATDSDTVQIVVNAEDTNQSPTADAGSDDEITLPNYATLDGTVSDDGLPDPPASVTTTWSKDSGPGNVTFGDASAVDTTAGFSEAGTYILQLTADDGTATDSDTVLIAVNAAPAGSGPFQEEGGTVIMEAENWDDNDTGNSDGMWTFESTYTVFVGDGYMVAPTYSSNQVWADGGAELDYNIDFETAGTYRVYMRRYHANPGGQNACNIGLDGANGMTFDNSGLPQNQWVWTTHNAQYYITAASHTFNIRRYETAYRIDRIVLTTDTSWSPSGTGPPESERSGGGPPSNTAPTADAGSDDSITLPNYATLDGTISDDGLPDPPASVTTTWSKDSGPGTVTFGDASAVDTTAGFSENGVYVLQLTADDGTLTDSDTVQITVNHLAPTADAGSDDECTLPAGVTLDGTISDDGFPLSPGSVTTTWTKTSGPGTVTFGNSAAVDTTAGFSEAGAYVLQLEASDGDLSDSDTVAITVNAEAGGTGPFQEEGGTVVMETENYDTSDQRSENNPWSEETSWAGYVGDGYMQAPGGGSKTWATGAELTYEIDFSTAGTYYIWMRRYADSKNENAALVGLDGTQIGGTFDDQQADYDQWIWKEHGTAVYISATQHTFNLRKEEKNYGVDRIILTDDGGYTPSGNGPAESSRQ